MDTDPADVWAQMRDRLTDARKTVTRLEHELTGARVRLATAEADETDAWHKLNDARREVAQGAKQ